MNEPAPGPGVFGVIAEFDRPECLIAGVQRAREAGFLRMDAYSPFPVEGLAEALGFRERRIPWLGMAGGLFGAALGFGMQVYASFDYPIDIGGRPLVALPAFMLITFELTVLFAVLLGIGGMLALNHLPRLHHPLFDVERFHLASSNRFFLVIFSNDGLFDQGGTRRFLQELAPVRVDVVRHTEAPE